MTSCAHSTIRLHLGISIKSSHTLVSCVQSNKLTSFDSIIFRLWPRMLKILDQNAEFPFQLFLLYHYLYETVLSKALPFYF